MSPRKKIGLLVKYLRYLFMGSRNPFWVDMKLTSRCNTSCRYCSIAEKGVDHELTKEEVFSIADELAKHGCFLSLGGGEPLLRPDIDDIINYVQDQDGVFLCVWTNAILFEQHKDALKRVSLLGLSIDGDRNANDQMRGKGTYDKTLDALRWARKESVNTYVHTTLSRYSIRHIDHVLSLSQKYGHTCSFHPIIDYPLAPDKIRELALPEDQLEEVINYLIRMKGNFKIINSEEALKSFIGDKPRKCYAGKLFLHVDTNGDIYPCGFKVGEYKSPLNINQGIKQSMGRIRSYKRCENCYATTLLEANLALSGNLGLFLRQVKHIS